MTDTPLTPDMSDRKQEGSLHESEERYRTLIDNMQDGVFVIQDGKMQFVNEAFADIVGYSVDEVIGMDFTALIAPEDLTDVADNYRRRQAGEPVPSFYEWRMLHKNGDRMTVSMTVGTVNLGGQTASMGTVKDITAHKRAEAAIQESQQKFKMVADFTYDWETWLGPDEEYIYVSPACERITGYTAQEFVEHPELFAEIVHPDDLAHVQAHLHAHQSTIETEPIEYRITTKDGKERWIGHACQPVYDDEGNWMGRRGSNRDITERVQVEKTLKENEERLDLALEAAEAGVWEFLPLAGEAYFSDRWFTMLGYEPGELSNSYETWVSLLHPDDLEATEAIVNAHIQAGSDFATDFRMKTRDGKYRWIRDIGHTVETNADGISTRMLGTHTDITEQKLAEQERQRYTLRLSTASDIAVQVNNILDPDELLNVVIPLLKQRFGLYYAHVYTLEEGATDLVLRAGYGEPGRVMLERGHSIPLDSAKSLVARAARGKEIVVVGDIRDDPDFLPNELLPDTRAEVSVPMIVGDRVLGVFDIQHDEVDYFTDADLDVFRTLAGQIATAFQNARLFAQVELSETRFRNVIESTSDWIWEVDEQGRYVYVSENVEPALGYTTDEMLGKTAFDFMLPQEAERIAPIFGEIIAHKRPIEGLENWNYHKDGHKVCFVTNGVPMLDEAGNLLGYRGVDKNVTQSKKAEATLQENERQLADALRIAKMGHWEFDVETQTFTFNDQYYKTFHNATAKEIGGYQMSAAEFAQRFVPPEDAPVVGQNIQMAIQATDPDFQTQFESRNLTIDGKEMWVSVWLTTEKDTDGRTVKLHGVNQDVTERKLAEMEMERFAGRLNTAADIAEQVGAILDPDELLKSVIPLIKEQFGLYYVHVYTLDKETGMLSLRAGYGKAGEKMLAEGHSIPLDREASLVATAARTKEVVLVDDVTENPNFMPNPLLPDTKTEVAVPSIAGGQVLGVFDVQHDEAHYFTQADLDVFQTLAAQIANAFHSAELYKTAENERAFYDGIITNLPVGVWAVDNQFTPLLVNPAGREMMGREVQDKGGGAYVENYDVINVETGELYDNAELPLVKAVTQGGAHTATDAGVRHPDGTVVPQLINAAPLYDVTGEQSGAVVIFVDATEQKQAEEAIQESQVKFQLVADFTYDWEYWFGIDNEMVYVSPACEKITGYTVDEFMDNPHLLDEIVLPEDRELLHQHMHNYHENPETLATAQEMAETEFRIVRKDGAVRWIGHACQPVYGPQGEWLGRRASNRDVTENKQAEAERERFTTRLNTAAQISEQVGSILDPDELLHTVIPLIKEQFGLYHVHVYTLDEKDGTLNLRAGYGEAGKKMLAEGHSIPLDREASLVATAARTKEVVLVDDVTEDPNFLPNPLLPDTKTEVAVPSIAGGQVLGVFDVQHDEAHYFTQADLDVFQTLAAQIANAFHSAELYEQVERDRTLYDTILTNLPVGVWVADNQFNVLLVNETQQQMMGREITDRGGSTHTELYDVINTATGEPYDETIMPIAHTMTDGGRYTADDLGIRQPDGTVVPVMSTSAALLDAEGEQMGAIVITTDISEQVAAQKAIQESQVKFQLVADFTYDWEYWLGIDNEMVYVSPACEKITGYTVDEFMDNPHLLDEIVLPEDHELLHQHMHNYHENPETLATAREVAETEFRIVRKDGAVRWIGHACQPVYGPQGEWLGRRASNRDVTENKQAEAERERFTLRLSTASDIAGQVNSILEPDALLNTVIPLLKERFGLYYAHVYTLEEGADALKLRAGYGEPGRIMLERGHSIALDSEKSLVARAARDKEVIVVDDVTQAPDFLPNELLPDTRSEVAVPMVVGDQVLGVFDIQHDQPDYFTDADLDVFRTLSGQIATALQNATFVEQVEASLTETATRLQISQALADAQTEDQVTETTVQTANLYPQAGAGVLLFDPAASEPTLVLHRFAAFESEIQFVPDGTKFPASQFMLMDQLGPDQDFVTPNILTDERADAASRQVAQSAGIVSTLTLPITVGAEWIGILLAASPQEGFFDAQKLTFYRSLAEQSAAAIQAARLRDALSLTQFSVDRATESIFWIRPDGSLAYVNDTTCQRLGYSREELLEMTVFDLDPNFPQEIWTEHWNQVKEQKQFSIETQHQTKDGRLVPVEVAINYIEYGGQEYNSAFARDITERKLAEVERERLTSVIESTTDMIGIADAQGQGTYMNRAGRELIGMSKDDDISAINIADLQPAHEAARINQEALPIAMREGTWSGESVIKALDGREIPVLMVLIAQKDADGNLQYLANVARDISAIKQAEAEVQAERDRAQMYLDMAGTIIVAMNDQGNVTLLNETGLQVLGYEKEEAIGQSWFDLTVPEAIREDVKAVFQQIMAGEMAQAEYYENEIITKDGNVRIVAWHNSLLKDEKGNIIGALSSGEDITERMQAQAERERFTTQLNTAAQISEQVGSILDPDELLHTVIPLIKEQFGLYHVHVYTLDEKDGTLNLRAGYGKAGKKMLAEGHSIPLDREASLVATAARTKEVVLVDDVTEDPNFMPNPLLPDTKTEVAVPSIAGGQVLGVFDVQHDEAHYFTQADLDVFQTLAAQIANAFHSAELLTETAKAQVRFQLVADFTYDWEYWFGIDNEMVYVSPACEKITGYTVDEFMDNPHLLDEIVLPEDRELLHQHIHNYHENPETLATAREVAETEFRIVRKDGEIRWIGHACQPVYGPEGEWLGRRASNRDVTENKQAEAERERFTTRLETAANISEQVGNILNPDELLHTVIPLIKEQFGLYYVHVYTLDQKTGMLNLRAGYGKAGEKMLAEGHSIPLDREASLVATAARTKAVVHVPDVTEDPNFMPNPLLPDTKTEVAVPSIAGGQVLGVFDVQHDQAHYFTQADLDVFQTLAAQIANAFQSAELYEQVEHDRTLYDSILGNLPVGVWVADMDFNVLLTNTYQQNMMGREIQDLQGRTHTEQYDVIDTATGAPYDETQMPIVKTMTDGQPHSADDLGIRKPDGSVTPVLTSTAPLLDTDGNRIGTVAITADMTEQKQAQAAIQESQQKFKTVADFTYDWEYWLGVDNEMLYVSPACEKITGYAVNEFIDNPNLLDEIVSSEDRALLHQHMHNYHENPETQATAREVAETEFRIVHKDGAVRWIGHACQPVYGPEGAWLGRRASNRDITERVKAEAEQARLTAILETTTDLVSISTPDGQLIYMNRAGREMLGLDDAAEVSTLDISQIYPLWAAKIVEQKGIPTAMRSGTWTGQTALLSRSGREIPVSQVIMTHHTSDGKVEFISTIMRDITEQQRAAAERERFTNQLRTSAEISAQMSAILDTDALLEAVVSLTKQRFDLYHVHFYELDQENEDLIMRAGYGQVGRIMRQQGHKIPLGRDKSLVARAARDKEIIVIHDVTQEEGYLPNMLLPDTRSEVALPAIVGDQVLGVFDVQSDQPEAFTEADLDVFKTMVGQIATAFQNARYFEQQRRSELALKESAEKIRAMFDAITDGITVSNMMGEITDLNEASLRLFNYERPEELLGRNTIEMIAPEQRSQAAESFTQALQSGSSGLQELKLLRSDGSTFGGELSAALLRDEEGNPTGFINVSRDITERMAAQQAVRESEERFRILYENSPLGFILNDKASGDYIQVNQSFLKMMGYTLEELNALSYWDVTPEKYAEDEAEQIRSMDTTGRYGPYEKEYIRKDGSLVPVVLNGVVVTDPSGRELVWSIVEDITERRRVEAERERFTTQLGTAADVSAQASAILDPGQLLEEVVPLVQERFNLYHVHVYTVDEAQEELVMQVGTGEVGETMREQGHTIPFDQERSLVARAARTKKTVLVNDTTQEPDFMANPLLPNTRSEVAVPFVAGDEVVGVLDVQDDEPDRFTEADLNVFSTLAGQIAQAFQNARLFKEIQKTADRLREVDRLKSEFLANMSHELRTPLNSILGYTEIMLMGIDGELPAETIEDVQAIYDNGQHLLRLINDILDLAKIEAQRMTLEFEEVDIAPLFNEVKTSNAGLFLNKPLELRLEIVEDLPAIWADRVRINQILNNLISNAVKFTQEGHINLCAYREGEWINLEVQDTGIGMSAEDLDKVFERFQQADGSNARRAEGTGLGLAITRHLVHMHGGTIDVQSEPGKGSTFTVHLPIERQEQAPTYPIEPAMA